MDAEVALSKVSTGLRRLLLDTPQWTGRYQVEMRFRRGKVVKLKKVALRPVL